ncbi:hypothetical protein [Carboxydothermus pertinax]|uniref:Uncharacterized protein n=1 Tax=Carboxydothermus pertinax TaxID=870242 RepID=A0A1L8CX94_9THEO|nr:hypothetical protein [Carboxydothermus pertinax]GAV23555.1 hypothetical protein cpu_20650 [Carboxydothermus pertinax]
MENQVLDILQQIMHDVQGLKHDINDLKQDMQNMKQEMQVMKQEMQVMKQDIAKNATLIEENNRKLQLLAEIQKAHREQTDRQIAELKDELNKRMDVIEAVVKNISQDVKQNQKNFFALAEITGIHEMEIKVIKKELALALAE